MDYALTITISAAAGASAIIAYVPSLASWRIPLALTLLVVVAGLTWFGHGGRVVFAAMTIAFVVVTTVVLTRGIADPVARGTAPLVPAGSHKGAISVLLAFPVAMALATGVEAPSSAIAQLGQLDDAGRRRFGRVTLWLMLAIVVTITAGLSYLAVSLRVGLPGSDSTEMAEVARAATGGGTVFAAFQVTTAVLLLAAASSSFQAGPGLLKALSRGGGGVERTAGHRRIAGPLTHRFDDRKRAESKRTQRSFGAAGNDDVRKIIADIAERFAHGNGAARATV